MSEEPDAREAEDSALFGMEGAAGTGEVSVEETKSNRRRFLYFAALVGIISVALVMCIGVSVGSYVFLANRKSAVIDADGPKKTLPPLKEQPARIKEVDVEQQGIRLLVKDGKYQTFQITEETTLYDAAGNRLKGIAALEEHKDAAVMILMTEDRQGLQWLKLTK